MSRLLTLLALAVILASVSQASTVDTVVLLNSSTCLYFSVGDCTFLGGMRANPIPVGGDTSGSFSSNFSIGSDPYTLTGTYEGSYDGLYGPGTVFSVTLNLTYTGTGLSANNDSIQIDLEEAIQDTSFGNWNGLYSENAPICISGAAGSTATAQFFVQGSGLGQPQWGAGLLGPYSLGCSTFSNSATLGTTANPINGNYLIEDWQYVFNMQSGTSPGSGAVVQSMTPEPSEVGLIAACVAYLVFRKKEKR